MTNNDIILVVDYHDENMEVRRLSLVTGEECRSNHPTTMENIVRLVEDAEKEAAPWGGGVVWIMESTTGWARVKDLIGSRVRFVVANVLQMPLPPKGRRRKTDKIDTGRLLREYLNGSLPTAFLPEVELRQLRRLVGLRENQVSRRTALRNWINRYLAHETWEDRDGLWTQKGRKRLARIAQSSEDDEFVLDAKLKELDLMDKQLEDSQARIQGVRDQWELAQWVDEIRGIGPVSAVSMLARIGTPSRFKNSEELISFAGLAPGVHQSDGPAKHGRIGGGGTDKHLRFYLLEAAVWACKIPRYRPLYDRTCRKHGKRVGRITVARHLLRSIFKMFRDHVKFSQVAAA